jgi:hypothetical protein
MRMKLIILPLAIVSTGLCLTVQTALGLTVTSTSDADTLANTILGSGITLNSASYSGAAAATGTFTGGTASGLGIDTGIILTSGDAQLAVGPNNAGSAGFANGLAGSALLNQLVPGYTTYDAAILTLNFTTATDGGLYFNYVFGSEEYNEWVGSSYNDVFGFFLDGSAVANNIALIPGTSTPVAINNVNNGLNSAYYRDNTDGHLNLQYDGLTTVLQASFANLSAGSHTIQLAIADSGDNILDSGVFIQGSTFSTTPTPTGVPDAGSTFALLGMALSGMALLRRKK